MKLDNRRIGLPPRGVFEQRKGLFRAAFLEQAQGFLWRRDGRLQEEPGQKEDGPAHAFILPAGAAEAAQRPATLELMLTEQEFSRLAGDAIESLYRKLAEASDEFDFDVDLNAGALTIEFEDPRERFVVSPNSPVRQIWVSAHVKSYKLGWNGSAFALEDGRTLEDLIADAIRVRIPDFTF